MIMILRSMNADSIQNSIQQMDIKAITYQGGLKTTSKAEKWENHEMN